RALHDANPYKSDTATDIFRAGIWVSAPVDWKLSSQLVDAFAHAGNVGRIARIVQDVSDEVGRENGLGLAKTASRHGWRTQADAAGDKGLFRIVRNGVLVGGDVRFAQRRFSILARNAFGPQVYQHDVAFGTARNDAQTALGQGSGQRLRILGNLFGVLLELWRQGFLEGHGLGGDHVHERTAL